MLTWPSTLLPNPTLRLAAQTDSSLSRTVMDSGRSRTLRSYTTDLETFRASWSLTDAQYGIFRAIFRYELSSGADWFTIDLPVGGGFTTCTARFATASFVAKQMPVLRWDVAAVLELQTNPVTAP